MVKISLGFACGIFTCTGEQLLSQENGALLQIGNRMDVEGGRDTWLISTASESSASEKSAMMQALSDEDTESAKVSSFAEAIETVAVATRARAEAYASLEIAVQESVEAQAKAKEARRQANEADEAALAAEQEARESEKQQRNLLNGRWQEAEGDVADLEKSAKANMKTFAEAQAAVSAASEKKVQAFLAWETAMKKANKAQSKAMASHATAETAQEAEQSALELLDSERERAVTRSLLAQAGQDMSEPDAPESMMAEFTKMIEASEQEMIESPSDEQGGDAEQDGDGEASSDLKKEEEDVTPSQQFKLLQSTAADKIKVQMEALENWEQAASRAWKTNKKELDARTKAQAAEAAVSEAQSESQHVTDLQKEMLAQWQTHNVKELRAGTSVVSASAEAVLATMSSKVSAYTNWNAAATAATRRFKESQKAQRLAALATKTANKARAEALTKGEEVWDAVISREIVPKKKKAKANDKEQSLTEKVASGSDNLVAKESKPNKKSPSIKEKEVVGDTEEKGAADELVKKLRTAVKHKKGPE